MDSINTLSSKGDETPRTTHKEIFNISHMTKYISPAPKISSEGNKYIFSCPYQNCSKHYSVYSRYLVHIRTHVINNITINRQVKSLLNVQCVTSPSTKKEI